MKQLLLFVLLTLLVVTNCVCEGVDDESFGYKEPACFWLDCDHELISPEQCLCSCTPCAADEPNCYCHTGSNTTQEVCDKLCLGVRYDGGISDADTPDYGAHSCLSYCVAGEYHEECMAQLACCQAVCR